MMIIITNTNNDSSRIQTTFFKQTRFFSKENPRKIPFQENHPQAKPGGFHLVQLQLRRPNLDLKLHNASTILHSPGGNPLEMEDERVMRLEFSGKMEASFKSFESNVAPSCSLEEEMNIGGKKSHHLFSWKNFDTTKWVKSYSWNSQMLIFSIFQTTSWTPIICEMFIHEFINI